MKKLYLTDKKIGSMNIESIKSGNKPFLRWAGGKSWLVKDINNFLPSTGYRNYIEPFLGGGAIFFHLNPQKAFLSDFNSELVDCYSVLKEDVEGLIIELSKFKNTKEHYYQVRSEKPNNDLKRAARFIYLNQTSFNGIYRENLQGVYNVPYGYRTKNFLQEDVLRAASLALSNVTLKSRDFADSIEDVNPGDLVFLDPPYTVTHNNNGFIKYNAKLFDLKSQLRLVQYIETLEEIGAYYIVTNAAHEWIKQNFKTSNNTIKELQRASLIGGANAKREKYGEYIITNIL